MENLNKAILIRNGNVIGTMGDKYFSTAPLGTVLSYAGQIAPYGYLICDGASYLVKDYPDLYAVIGNTYGGDDTNFNVPDYRETVLVGVGENTTDTIASHDVYELGEFKDDQFQGHWHNLGNLNGTVTVALGASIKGSNVQGANPGGENRYTVDLALDAISDGTNGTPRVGTTTHGKQKGVTYIIKAFHTNEGTDSGVSDDVIEYVAGELDKKAAIDDTQTSTDAVWSSKKTSDELAKKDDNANTFSLAGGDFVFEIELTDKKSNIEIVDNCGGKIEIYGNGTFDNYNNYKFIKVLRLSYGTWTAFDATTINNTYIKIKKVYIDNNKKCYVCVRGNANYIIKGAKSVEVKNLSDIDVAQLVEVPESCYTSINDTTSSTTSTYSSSKIDEKYGSLTLASEGATKWLKLKLGTSSKFHPIVVSDQYGGKVEILGMANDGTYKPVKLVRHSYGDWTTYSATDYTTTDQGDANYKIRRLFYYPTDSCYYLEIRQWAIIKVEGNSTAEMVASLPAETSAMTLIPETQFASKTDLDLTTKLAQGGSPFTEMYASESPYRKLTARCFYGRQQVFKVVGSNGYSGKIFVAMHGVELNNAVVKVVTENGTAPFELKYGNTKALAGSGHYSIDLFIHKTKLDVITLNIIPVAQGMSPYTITYTSADFVTSTATDFESAENTATFTSEYATKADLGSNVPMKEIAFTNSTNWSNSSGNLKTFYMVRNGWCFLHVVAHCNKVANDSNSVVYSGLPKPPFQVYGKFLGETLSVEPCELTITPDGKMLLRGGTVGKDYSFTYTYPVA